jgi:DNA polymerase-3 subunit alpha
MQAIKNVGSGAVEDIIHARNTHGKFAGLEDFFSKVNPRIVNKKAVESLIRTGAFDNFEERGTLLHNIDALIAFAAKKQKEQSSGQTDLFGNQVETAKEYGPQLVLSNGSGGYNLHDYLQWERELLGLYLLQHPLESYKTLFDEQTMPISDLTKEMDGKRVTVGGAVESSRVITTKTGKSMAFVKLSSLSGELELILFPSMLQQTIDMWAPDSIIIVKGKLNARDRDGNVVDDIKVIVDEARTVTLEQANAYQSTGKKLKIPSQQKSLKATKTSKNEEQQNERLYIRMQNTSDVEKLTLLKQAIDAQATGDEEVVLIIGSGEAKQAIRLPQRINIDDEIITELSNIFGSDNIKKA